MIIPNVVFCAAGVVRVVGNGTDLRLYGDNGNYIQIDPGSPGSNYTLVMPSSLGTEGQWYKLGSGGQLTFADITTDDVSGLGTAATLDVGTGANDIIQLNGSGQLPAVDGSLLTGISVDSVALDDVSGPTDNANFIVPNNKAVTFLNNAGDASIFTIGNSGSSPYVHIGSTFGYKLPLFQSNTTGWALVADAGDSVSWGIPVITLGQLDDTTVDLAPSTNDLLYFSSGAWRNGSLATIGIAANSHTHSLLDITDAGTAAAYNVGTNSGNIVQLDMYGYLPAVDGSQLINVNVGSHTHTLSDITDAGTAAGYNVGTGAGNIVQLDLSGFLPAIDGSQLTNVNVGSHSHILSDITDAGTAATYDVGTSANNIVQLDGSGLLPAVDGSQLTNLPITYETRCLSFAIFDSSTNTSVGDGTIGAVIAASLNGYELTDATATVHTAGTTNTTDIQVRRRRSGSDVDMLSTPITINSGAYTASDGVINTSNDDVQTGDMIYVDVDAISSTPAIGLSVVLTFTKP